MNESPRHPPRVPVYQGAGQASTGDDMQEPARGSLYVVSTPIGNLQDITVRAIEVLKEVHVIACEDTRKSRVLLKRWDISTRMVSLHRFTESKKTGIILRHLDQGRHVALIADAGTPNVSDPGARLVRTVLEAGFPVIPIPGASAVTAALSASGMGAQAFTFLGFAPRTDHQRSVFFQKILAEGRTAVFFDAPRRIVDTLRVASQVLGPARMALMRELTKMHEEILTGSSADVLAALEAKEEVRGEIVVVLEAGRGTAEPVDLDELVRELVDEGLTGKRLADEARMRYGVKKALAYEKYLEIKGE